MKIKILIVEDENIVAMDIRRSLTRIGYDVVGIAYTGQEALDMSGKRHPDLILMDVQLKGGMDGIETANQIRILYQIPVLFLTAYSDDATLERAKATEPYGYLLKPFEESELHTAIEVTIHKHRSIELRQTESQAALQMSENIFRILVDSVEEYAIVILDPVGKIVSWNSGAKRIAGYEISEIIGRHFSVFYPPEQIEAGEPNRELANAAAKGSTESEAWRVRKGGERYWAHITTSAIRDSAGKLLGYGKVVRDLTDRKTSEDCLKRSEKQKAAILENSMDCMITMDHLGIITDFSSAGERIFLRSKKDVIGQRIADIILPPRFRNVHSKALEKYLQTGVDRVIGRRIETTGIRASGEEFPLELSIVAMPFDDSVMFTAFLRDITERKRREEELKLAKEAAEVANFTKSAFLANMSHEIRTPLGIVLGYSELLSDPNISRSSRANFAASIRRNGELLSKVINDILDLSKVEAGKMDVEVRETNLEELVEDVRQTLLFKAQEKGIALNFHQSGSLPKIIRTDPFRLRQILLNIIGNAIKFTERGSVGVEIRSELGRDGITTLEFTIDDTGTGIPREKVEKLFLPFTQADSSMVRKFGGTGLGLNLAKRMAKLLGGDVQMIRSEIGRGSTFEVKIKVGKLTPRLSPLHMGTEALRPRRLDGIKILSVEDSPDNQFLLSRVLQQSGATVDLASNGAEALKKAKMKKYDVLLMDLQMPVMDGYEATAKLRESGYSVPIIALTAHALIEEKKRCLAGGFNDHLSKPVNNKLLIERIIKYSGRKALLN